MSDVSPLDRAFASPTGTPLISPKLVPWLTAAGAVAIAASETLPEHTVAAKVAKVAVQLLALFGLVSPGLRR